MPNYVERHRERKIRRVVIEYQDGVTSALLPLPNEDWIEASIKIEVKD